MQANRSRDTALELSVRRILYARGLRYQVDTRPLASLRCKADIVFRRVRVAVFLDGCFWHGCDQHFTVPKANGQYWRNKIGRNRDRDQTNNRLLQEAGWTVLRYWEHQSSEGVVDDVCAAVRGPSWHSTQS